MLRTIILTAALIATYSHANTVYKCQNGDQVTFSQMPCQTDNTKNEQLDYSNIKNVITSEPTQSNASQNNTPPNTYLLSKKKERSLAKIKRLKQKLNSEIEKIKTKGLSAGVNRAGAGYLKLLSKEVTEVRSKYQKSIDKEQDTLEKIEQKISQLEQ
ncbi:hypothetical protein tinsulaeT_04640 [Thalassotalea insulae]|uniref:DUF4124 domain-containing protein n=1 Tax=Thalassotalea insulae TaxID=2056778 RepID=A0ABQ6GPN5_9GAMM|nr:hypothetical protein [Thalassotalea insulae]GLX77124.1 hypothetical protein tinsulaeT_04640 [Thalassotalea insulae]